MSLIPALAPFHLSFLLPSLLPTSSLPKTHCSALRTSLYQVMHSMLGRLMKNKCSGRWVPPHETFLASQEPLDFCPFLDYSLPLQLWVRLPQVSSDFIIFLAKKIFFFPKPNVCATFQSFFLPLLIRHVRSGQTSIVCCLGAPDIFLVPVTSHLWNVSHVLFHQNT